VFPLVSCTPPPPTPQRTGSSLPAIKKFIGEEYAGHLPNNNDKLISTQLKRLVEKGDLVKVRVWL
jgi:hypothetical protein